MFYFKNFTTNTPKGTNLTFEITLYLELQDAGMTSGLPQDAA